MASIVIFVFAGVFALTGLGMVGVGLVRLRRWWTMRRLDPTGPTALEEGLQEFEGRAHAVADTVTAPFTGTESLVCTHRIERYSGGEGSNWNTYEEETRVAPFEIEHSGATVAVDAESAQTLLTDEFVLDTRKTDEYPERVQEFLDRHLDYDGDKSFDVGPLELDTSKRYRFTEQRLDDGEEVYVLGEVRRDPSAIPEGSTARMAIEQRSTGWRERLFGTPFVVSDTGEEEAIDRQLKKGLVTTGFGLLFTAIPLVIVLFQLQFF